MRLTTRQLRDIIVEEVKRATRRRRLNEVDQGGMESNAKEALLALGKSLQDQGGDQDDVRAALLDLVEEVCDALGHEPMPPGYYEG